MITSFVKWFENRGQWLRIFSRIAEPRNAVIVTLVTATIFGVAVWQSLGRHVGSLQPGAPELRAEARFNRDAVSIASRFDVGLDWMTVVFEAPKESCGHVNLVERVDDFSWQMQNVPGVVSVESVSTIVKTYNAGFNEGVPKMAAVPHDAKTLGYIIDSLRQSRGIKNPDCSMLAVNMYLTDRKATTIKTVLVAVKDFRQQHTLEGVAIRLASGNAGVQAAIDEVVEHSELPMLLYVYTVIVLLVFSTYRDWRAMLACCLPLTVATFIGYWFMKELEIGLTVATLPVMVLAVGIGVDYAFYIYNRLVVNRAEGLDIVPALERALQETGMATVFTAITLSVGVVTWGFSELKFQADMGKLLAFMFMINMLMAITALPAFAVVLEKLAPRRKPVRVPGIAKH